MALEDDHHHCKVCGAVCEPRETVCSPACQLRRDEIAASRRRLQYLMYGAILVLVVILAIQLR